LREIAGHALVLDDACKLAGRRRTIEAEYLDRVTRARRWKLLALVVVEGAHLAPRIARDDRVTDAQGAALHEHRRDGAAADVETRLDDRARRLDVAVRAQVELGIRDEQDPLELIV